MRILLAIDGSEFSSPAIDACGDFIETGKVEAVKVLSVYEAHVPVMMEPAVVSSRFHQQLNDLARTRARTTVRDAFEQLKERTRDTVVSITTTVELGQPAALIVDTAKKWHADMIIVGSHGRGFWGRFALGSVSDAVVHHSPCSVLVVRSDQP